MSYVNTIDRMHGYTKSLLAGAINWRGDIGAHVDMHFVVPRLTIVSDDYNSNEWLLNIGGVYEWKDDNIFKRWIWRCYDDEAIDILNATRPWLKSHPKRVQADLLLDLKVNSHGERLSELNPNILRDLHEARTRPTQV